MSKVQKSKIRHKPVRDPTARLKHGLNKKAQPLSSKIKIVNNNNEVKHT